MGIDGLFLHYLKNEIASFAIGARVDKLYQPSKNELVLVLRTRTESRKLFFSASGQSARVHFTEHSYENPQKPPMLCMLFRKQLSGAIITDVRQCGNDRILFFDFSATNEIGEKTSRTLVVEIMAQYSNIILVDENEIIIDSVKRVDSSKSSVREIIPKEKYVLPPQQGKLSFERNSTEELLGSVMSKTHMRISSSLLASIEGLSPLISREIAYRVCRGDCDVTALKTENVEFLGSELTCYKENVINNSAEPTLILLKDGTVKDFSFTNISQFSTDVKNIPVQSFSVLLDDFFYEKERLQRAKAKAEDLFKTVDNLIERISRKLNAQQAELEECSEKDKKRLFAELITANLYNINKGSLYCDVPNYYDEMKLLRIPLLPHLSPSQNAQRFFKEYRKAQTAEKILAEQMKKGRNDLSYLLSVKDELGRAETEAELSEIRTELSVCDFLKHKTGTKKPKVQPLDFLRFPAPDGFEIIIGRNNMQNDRLTFKTAAKTDYWFHTQKAPGSHVILSCFGREPTDKAMEFAAGAAAFFSSVRSSSAEVDYTQVRNLKKPPASNPGFVIYHIYSTILSQPINPSEYKEDETNI